MTDRPVLRYGSVCSGIEAASAAWEPLGWQPVFFAEIEPFPCAVLSHHYPEVPNLGDFTKIEIEPGTIDLLVGGTPCQSFSVAGLRKGLADDRGNLALEFLRLADRARPRWVVWENVPGVFSSLSHDAPDPRPPDIDLDGDNGPRDGEEVVVVDEYDADESHALACFLAGLSELGYGWAYRVLDAQHLGVPQRRRRVFVVGYLGDWRRAAAVLFERHSLSGHPAPGKEEGTRVARSLKGGTRGGGGQSSCDGQETLIASGDSAGGGLPGVSGADGLTAASESSDGQGSPRALIGTFQNTGQGWWNESDVGATVRTPDGGGSKEANIIAAFSSHGHGQFREGLGMVTARDGKDGFHAGLIAHTLRGDGFDASEDGTGRGTPLVISKAWGISSDAVDRSGEGDGSSAERAGLGIVEECSPAIRARPNNAVAYQCHGNNVGPMGTLREGDGGLTSGVPFIVNAAESCATQSHARESQTARCIDSTGSFANAQGGTVVMQPIPIDMRQASRGETMTNNRKEGSSGGAPGVGVGEPGDPSPSLSLSHPPAIAFQERGRAGGPSLESQSDIAYSLNAPSGGGRRQEMNIAYHAAVRRLTPLECERLQGFSDGWTDVPFRGKDASDGPRYKALGNSMAIPPMRWIGERITQVEAIP